MNSLPKIAIESPFFLSSESHVGTMPRRILKELNPTVSAFPVTEWRSEETFAALTRRARYQIGGYAVGDLFMIKVHFTGCNSLVSFRVH